MAENNTIVVPDASVLIKWALTEESNGVEESLRLQDEVVRGEIRMIAPSHCFYEVANTLSRLAPREAGHFISYLISYDLVEESQLSIELVRRTLEITKKYKGVVFYDAAYHALAILSKGIFITADAKYFAKTKAEGSIRLLS